MSWVRYDDQLEFNAKVTKAILADPGSMSLHLLANTWTSKTKHKGYVPRHQPGALMVDREVGAKWAEILVMVRLWHDVHDMCPECVEEYADVLPADADGWVFHNHGEYRAPARERQTPGTPTELSEKRAAAGRMGGKASGTTRAKQSARANEASGASKASKPASKRVSPGPVPEPVVASNEATTSPPVGDAQARQSDSGSRSAPISASTVVAAFINGATASGQDKPTTAIVNRVGRDAKRLIGEKVDFDKLLAAADRIGRAGWDSLDRELQRMSAERVGRTGHDPPQRDGRSVSTADEIAASWGGSSA